MTIGEMWDKLRRRREENTERERWLRRQQLARPGRFYGDGGTVHGTGHLDVETFNGEVIAVWFRCQMLPFQQVVIDEQRANSVKSRDGVGVRVRGIEVIDGE